MKEEITFEEFAKKASTDPERYKLDTVELAGKIKTYMLLYGTFGWNGLMQFLENL